MGDGLESSENWVSGSRFSPLHISTLFPQMWGMCHLYNFGTILLTIVFIIFICVCVCVCRCVPVSVPLPMPMRPIKYQVFYSVPLHLTQWSSCLWHHRAGVRGRNAASLMASWDLNSGSHPYTASFLTELFSLVPTLLTLIYFFFLKYFTIYLMHYFKNWGESHTKIIQIPKLYISMNSVQLKWPFERESSYWKSFILCFYIFQI